MKLKGIAYRPDRGAPMIEVESTEIDQTKGVQGDFGRKAGKFTLTLLSEQAWQKACDELDVDLPWTTRRANLLISDYEFLPSDVDRQMKVGEAVVEITRETNPCDLMEAAQTGLFNALTPDWRGGVRAKVVKGGIVDVGTDVNWIT